MLKQMRLVLASKWLVDLDSIRTYGKSLPHFYATQELRHLVLHFGRSVALGMVSVLY